MALIENTFYGKINKVQVAIERIRTFDPSQHELLQSLAPYYVAYSGGKDSDVLRILYELSGVEYDLVHNHTTVDAPETVYYIRSIPHIQISMPDISMWDLIVKKRMPPTRIVRYCCDHLKERGGIGRFVATGVRWAESMKRRTNRNGVEIVTQNGKAKVMLNADNSDSRRLIENCIIKGRRILNPIIDWSDSEVWEFLNHYNCKSNPLYECGYKRIGCIGCPMARGYGQLRDFARYPKYKQNYIKAFERMLVNNKERGILSKCSCVNGEDVFNWWVSSKPQQIDENQMTLFGIRAT